MYLTKNVCRYGRFASEMKYVICYDPQLIKAILEKEDSKLIWLLCYVDMCMSQYSTFGEKMAIENGKHSKWILGMASNPYVS